MNDFLMVH